jgi:acetyltransferase-like isoleucine patch superfamily enzyme
MACPDTSDEIVIGFMTILSHADTTIERGVYIGPQCNIGKCRIGEQTLLGSGVHILSGNQQHGFETLEVPIQQQGGNYHKINIGKDCWLGNGAIVMQDIADHCIVAAGSVVTRAADAGSILAGNPAKILRSRFEGA